QAFLYEPTKYARAVSMLLPGGALGLLAPAWLFPAAFSLLPHILSQAQTQLSLAEIYSIPTQPFVIFASALGARRVWERRPSAKPFLVGLAFVCAGVGIINTPRFFKFQPEKKIEAFHRMAALVPEEASVAAQQNLFPHFDARERIQIFPVGFSLIPLQ